MAIATLPRAAVPLATGRNGERLGTEEVAVGVGPATPALRATLAPALALGAAQGTPSARMTPEAAEETLGLGAVNFDGKLGWLEATLTTEETLELDAVNFNGKLGWLDLVNSTHYTTPSRGVGTARRRHPTPRSWTS